MLQLPSLWGWALEWRVWKVREHFYLIIFNNILGILGGHNTFYHKTGCKNGNFNEEVIAQVSNIFVVTVATTVGYKKPHRFLQSELSTRWCSSRQLLTNIVKSTFSLFPKDRLYHIKQLIVLRSISKYIWQRKSSTVSLL